VIDWWEIPEDRIYAVDLARFCEAEEDRSPTPPDVLVEAIDEGMADEILSHGESLDDLQAARERRHQVLTSVRTKILRPYRVK